VPEPISQLTARSPQCPFGAPGGARARSSVILTG
jgi:hypothetical protein